MKQRLTLYLTPEAADRLNLVANYRKGAKSALVEEALGRYLNPERNRLLDDAVLRRLDGPTRSVGVVARDVAIATETLSLFVRYFLTITAPPRRTSRTRRVRSAGSASKCSWLKSGAGSDPIIAWSPRCWRPSPPTTRIYSPPPRMMPP